MCDRGIRCLTWLLQRLPATAVGFTVFLNPPLTTLSKWALAGLFPAVFTFTIVSREWVGGLVTLLGMGVALGMFSMRRG